jgi:hypothetical protein
LAVCRLRKPIKPDRRFSAQLVRGNWSNDQTRRRGVKRGHDAPVEIGYMPEDRQLVPELMVNRAQTLLDGEYAIEGGANGPTRRAA